MQRTIKDVARHTGLSPSTVSRVLNRSGYVSPDTLRRVEEAVVELGYRPNWLARGLKGKPSNLIGLIIPDISNTYYTAVAQALVDALRAKDYEAVLCVNNEDPRIDLHYLQILQQKRVDGILYAHPSHGSNSAFVRELALGGLPIVELNRQREGDLLDSALADNRQGAYLMTQYLLRYGHRRIGLILGESDLTTGGNRLEGYRNALSEAEVVGDPALVRMGSFTRAHGEAATRALLALSQPPTVIFAGSNRILMGCLAVFAERGLVVPEDMSVVAFDNSEWLSIWRPPITAVDVAIDAMAGLAVDLLLRRIADAGAERKPVTYLLSTSIVERGSVAQVAAAPLAPASG